MKNNKEYIVDIANSHLTIKELMNKLEKETTYLTFRGCSNRTPAIRCR